jgi:hypothetical protein
MRAVTAKQAKYNKDQLCYYYRFAAPQHQEEGSMPWWRPVRERESASTRDECKLRMITSMLVHHYQRSWSDLVARTGTDPRSVIRSQKITRTRWINPRRIDR